MYCTQCGERIEDNSEFCIHCGAKLEQGQEQKKRPPEGRVNRLIGTLVILAAIAGVGFGAYRFGLFDGVLSGGFSLPFEFEIPFGLSLPDQHGDSDQQDELTPQDEPLPQSDPVNQDEPATQDEPVGQEPPDSESPEVAAHQEAVLVPENAAASCVNGGHTYALLDFEASWKGARDVCVALGGHLATITSQGEQSAIHNLVAKGSRNIYWLGGHLESDGQWGWVTGESFSYQNWAEGAPDNFRPEGHENDESLVEEALSMYCVKNPLAPHEPGCWNDLSDDGDCSGEEFFGIENIGFVCEWDEE